MSHHRVPEVSTLLLNWNRGNLLERTLHSYLATVSVEHEVLVVDNGSTDGSQEIIEVAREHGWIDDAVLLPENLGGDAINTGLDRLRGSSFTSARMTSSMNPAGTECY